MTRSSWVGLCCWVLVIWWIIARAAGQSIEENYSPHDCAMVAGRPSVPLPCSARYTDATMPIPALRYGYASAALSYAIPAPNGAALLTLKWVEPNKTAVGLRRFRVRINQAEPFIVDAFEWAGRKKLAAITIPLIVENGMVQITMTALAGNAMISAIELRPMAPAVTTWLTCQGGGTFNNCDGLHYLVIYRGGQQAAELWGVAPPDDWLPNSANGVVWSKN